MVPWPEAWGWPSRTPLFSAGLSVETVRHSGRSREERGDNLVLFGQTGQAIPGLYVEESYYFA
jgi:hypothetical protein